MIDAFALFDTIENLRLLVGMIGRDQKGDVFAYNLGGRVAEDAFRTWIPSGDQAVERDAENGVSGRFYNRRETSAGFISSFALEELANLLSNAAEHLKEAFIGDAGVSAETFDNAKHFMSDPDWETNRRMEPCLRSGRGAREIGVVGDFSQPNRFTTGPDTTRQAHASRKAKLAGDFFEVGDVQGRDTPNFEAVKFIGASFEIPYDAQFPSAFFTKTLKNSRCGFLESGCFCENAADGVLDLEPLFSALSVGDD